MYHPSRDMVHRAFMEQQSNTDHARKTTELGSGAKPVQSEQLTGFAFLDFLEGTTKTIGHLLVILLVFLVTSRIIADVLNRPIRVDPVIVPKTMEEEGYTGVVAANRIAGEMDRIERATETLAPKYKFDLNSEPVPDIEMPETKLSLTSTITFLEDFLGIAPRHLSAELILESGEWHQPAPITLGMERVAIFIRINGRQSRTHWSEAIVRNPDEAVMHTAREALEMIDPYLLGVYVDEVEYNLTMALSLIQEASEQDPDNCFIYTGWGAILSERPDYDGAIAKYQQALKLDPKNGGIRNNIACAGC